MATLSEAFPDLARQWDYERNNGLTPDDVTYGSNKIVWWKCPSCGHSYQKKIANRTAPAKRKTESDKCPICLGRVIVPGFNSLKAKFPEIIEKEWDFEIKLEALLAELSTKDIKVDFGAEINDVRATLDCLSYEKSCAASEEQKRKDGIAPVALWDYEANAPLTPEMVTPKSAKRVNWICPTNPDHKWNGTVASVSNGFGCKECSGWRYRYTTEEWIAEAKKVHGDKYQYHSVRYVDSETKVDIVCPKHGVFSQVPYYHLQGQGCPCCVHQKFHPSESLATLYPDIAAEWDYELNASTGYTPYNIGINTRKKFYWHCNNGCNHSYLATIAFRVKRNSGCAICHGKQTSPDTNFGDLYPELAKEWCEENDKTPFEITPRSEYRALWKCANPDHPPFSRAVYYRTKYGMAVRVVGKRLNRSSPYLSV